MAKASSHLIGCSLHDLTCVIELYVARNTNGSTCHSFIHATPGDLSDLEKVIAKWKLVGFDLGCDQFVDVETEAAKVAKELKGRFPANHRIRREQLLFLIDECMLESLGIFLVLDAILREFHDSDKLFGGLAISFFGDGRQVFYPLIITSTDDGY